MSQRLKYVAEKTGIPAGTLRKYYVAENDYDEKTNRFKGTSGVRIAKLAELFGVNASYLSGKSKIKQTVQPKLLSVFQEESLGLDDELEEGLIAARNSRYWPQYRFALTRLLTNTHEENGAGGTPEFALLYYLALYLGRPFDEYQVTVPYDLLEEASKLLKHQNINDGASRAILSRLMSEKYIQPVDEDAKWLEKVVDQLKPAREAVRALHQDMYKMMAEVAEGHAGAVAFVDDESAPDIHQAIDCGAYEKEFKETVIKAEEQ